MAIRIYTSVAPLPNWLRVWLATPEGRAWFMAYLNNRTAVGKDGKHG